MQSTEDQWTELRWRWTGIPEGPKGPRYRQVPDAVPTAKWCWPDRSATAPCLLLRSRLSQWNSERECAEDCRRLRSSRPSSGRAVVSRLRHRVPLRQLVVNRRASRAAGEVHREGSLRRGWPGHLLPGNDGLAPTALQPVAGRHHALPSPPGSPGDRIDVGGPAQSGLEWWSSANRRVRSAGLSLRAPDKSAPSPPPRRRRRRRWTQMYSKLSAAATDEPVGRSVLRVSSVRQLGSQTGPRKLLLLRVRRSLLCAGPTRSVISVDENARPNRSPASGKMRMRQLQQKWKKARNVTKNDIKTHIVHV